MPFGHPFFAFTMDYQQQPQLLSHPQLLEQPLLPQPPPQQQKMSIKIIIQVQPFPPKQLFIKKTSFFVYITYYAIFLFVLLSLRCK